MTTASEMGKKSVKNRHAGKTPKQISEMYSKIASKPRKKRKKELSPTPKLTR